MHKVSGSMPQLCIVILPTKAKEIVFDGIGLSTRPVSVCLSVSLSLAIVNNCSLNSSRKISGLQQPSSSLASLEKEGQSALRSFQLGRADDVSMEP